MRVGDTVGQEFSPSSCTHTCLSDLDRGEGVVKPTPGPTLLLTHGAKTNQPEQWGWGWTLVFLPACKLELPEGALNPHQCWVATSEQLTQNPQSGSPSTGLSSKWSQQVTGTWYNRMGVVGAETEGMSHLSSKNKTLETVVLAQQQHSHSLG